MIPIYTQIASQALTESQINVNKEGIAVIDVNADGRKDIVITNAGSPSRPISASDPPITILFGQRDGTFTPADTTALAPTGWVNDYVFIDSNSNGYLEIVAIDHGREIAFDERYWSRLPVYEFDPRQNKFIEYTNQTQGNSIAFYHNSANTADVNQDGLNDFIVASMSLPGVRIFLGDPTYIFKEAAPDLLGSRYSTIVEWNSSAYITPGAGGAIDLGGDGDFDLFLLPYTDQYTNNQEYGQLFKFENGRFIADQFFNVRDTNALSLPAEWGYSFSRIEDVNNDGLQDILAFAESPANNVGGTAIFVSMIQKADGTFEISPAFPAEPLITNRKGELFAGNLWHDYKFSLEDLDGDKDLDLYWGQWFGGYQSYFKDGIFLNDGTGHFFRDTSIGNLIANQVTWSGNSGAKTYMSDLDFDGIGDFLVFDSDWASGQMLTTVRAFYSSNVSNYSSIHFGGLRKYYDLEISSSNIKIVDQLMTDGIAYMARDGRVVFQDIAIAFDLEGISGNAARLLAAVFGKDAVKNPTYAGIAISLFDQGLSKGQVSQVALNAVFGANAKSKDVVSLIWKNLTGSTIDDKNLADLSGLIDSKAITAAQLTTKAADLDLTAQLIDLVGLSKTGWEYIPYGE